MSRVISCVFDQLEEVTPYVTEITLFYSGNILCTQQNTDVSRNLSGLGTWTSIPCCIWSVPDFKYNPIEDARFAIFNGIEDNLTADEHLIIDLVVNTFGEYGER